VGMVKCAGVLPSPLVWGEGKRDCVSQQGPFGLTMR
jgi:hypothetical protein